MGGFFVYKSAGPAKSVQIRYMRHIYSKADEVYAWLGRQDNDKAADAIFFLEMLLLGKCDEMLSDASNGHKVSVGLNPQITSDMATQLGRSATAI